MNYKNWLKKLYAREPSENIVATSAEIEEVKKQNIGKRCLIVYPQFDTRADRRKQSVKPRGGVTLYHNMDNRPKSIYKAKWDCSPLSIEEKLFKGSRNNPTPRSERTYIK